jgi:hypothetical protein
VLKEKTVFIFAFAKNEYGFYDSKTKSKRFMLICPRPNKKKDKDRAIKAVDTSFR